VLGGIFRPILKLAVMVGAVLFGTVLLAGIAVFPLHHMHPATPQFMKTVGAGIPVLCFGAGFLALVFAKEWRVMKYAAPVGFIAPYVVFALSSFIALPYVLSTMTPVQLVAVGIAVVSIVMVIFDGLTGRLSGSPWLYRPFRQKTTHGFPDVVYPIAGSQSSTSQAQVGAFEIVETPEEYVRNSERPDVRVWEPYRNVLRAMMAAGAPLGHRLEQSNGVTREFYLTLGKTASTLLENMNLLQRVLESILPKFQFARHDTFTSLTITEGAVGSLSGEILTAENARQRADPVTVVAEAMLTLENGVFQTFALPVSPGIIRSFRRVMTGRSYKSKMQKAQHTISAKKGGLFSGGSEASSTVVDVETATKADSLYQKYQRYRVEHACNVEIVAVCWGLGEEQSEKEARHILEVAKSAIVPSDAAKDLKVRIHKGKDLLQRVMSGFPIGETTLHTLEETAILFTLPRCDIGVVFSKRGTFSTATKPIPTVIPPEPILEVLDPAERKLVYSEWIAPKQNAIILGNPIGAGGSPIAGQFVWFHPQKFESHVLVLGNIRSGKTTTAFSIVAQTIRCGIKVLILVPRRPSDWIPLIYLFPDDLWILKVGGNAGNRFGINMFRPPNGVTVANWIRALGDVLSSWMPNDRVMRIHLDDVLHATYRNCGWDSKTDTRGRPILLSDLWDAIEEVCLNIPYGDEVRQNFYGAIYSRISNLIRNKILVDMYNTEEGITWEQLATHNIIIDTQDLLSDEDNSFFMALIATGIHLYKMVHSTKEITNLLVLEEASYILKRPKDTDFYGPDSGSFAVSRILDILTTGGGNGLGVMILEQVPTRLVPEAIKLVVNTIVHALGDESERALVAGHIGIGPDRYDHLQQMRKGETVVYLEGEGAPRSVKILPLDKHLDFPLPDGKVTDAKIASFMKPVFDRHPNLSSHVDIPDDIIERIERAKPSEGGAPESGELIGQKAPKIEVLERIDIHDFVDHHVRVFALTPEFVNNLAIRLQSAKEGDFDPLVTMVTEVSEGFLYEGVKQSWIAERVMVHSNDLYPDMLDKRMMSAALVMLEEQIG
jgi:hypothetical protein